MKKSLKGLLILFAAIMMLFVPKTAKAETSSNGDWKYDADYYVGTCTITGYNGDLAEITDISVANLFFGFCTVGI